MNDESTSYRWRLLRNYVTRHIVNPRTISNCLLSANVFGLFRIEKFEESSMVVFWHLIPRNTLSQLSHFIVGIPKALPQSHNLEDLVGFDRTGVAVSLWPCELLLAHVLLCPSVLVPHIEVLPTCKRVIELAAGSLGVAGLSTITSFSSLEYLALTDGNENCVRNMQCVVNATSEKCSFPKIDCTLLRWSTSIYEL